MRLPLPALRDLNSPVVGPLMWDVNSFGRDPISLVRLVTGLAQLVHS